MSVGRGVLDAPVLDPKGRRSGPAYNLGHAVGRALLALMWGVLVLPDLPDSTWLGMGLSLGLLSFFGSSVRNGLVALAVVVCLSTPGDALVSRALTGGIVLAAGNILADALSGQGYERFREPSKATGLGRVLSVRFRFWNRGLDLVLLTACTLGMWVAVHLSSEELVLLPNDADGVLALLFGVFITAGSVRAPRTVARSEAEREAKAAAAVSGERARIARELHDVVAHRLSGMVVQSQVAQAVDASERSSVLATIERESRAALDELRSLLGALRADAYVPVPGDEPVVEPPQERLDDATLARFVSAPPHGITQIEAEVRGDVRMLPDSVALQALRVLREALANAGRHAPGGAVRIEVERDDAWLRLTVLNGAGGPSAGGGTGVGLVGMRERAALVGGTLEAGPAAGGGWRVELRCPLPA